MSAGSNWEKINDFRGYSEFDRFVSWIEQQVKNGTVEEVAVTSPYANTPLFREQWYRHKASGETWRLVWPDPPFPGVFERIK